MKVPFTKPMLVCFIGSQQFVLSRAMVHRRPREVWARLLHMLGEDEVCVRGEPDYEHLYAYRRDHERVGPETPDLEAQHEGPKYGVKGWGRTTQGGTAEHLAHVIFGHYELDMNYPDQALICQNFLPGLPHSPCPANYQYP